MKSQSGGSPRGRMTAVAGLALLAIPLPVVAAPFCVQTQAIPPQCIYFDAESCNDRAREMGGTCSVNTAEAHISAGLGHYCLFTSAQVSACIYPDRGACDAEAQHQHGVCVAEPNPSESPTPDPYRDVRPLMVGGD
jgi:hypothetical protein